MIFLNNIVFCKNLDGIPPEYLQNLDEKENSQTKELNDKSIFKANENKNFNDLLFIMLVFAIFYN